MSTPTPRADWSRTAASDALVFEAAAQSFKSLDPSVQRSTFADMAKELIDLGKGKTVVVNRTRENHPRRQAAYLDAVTMGENDNIRNAMLSSDSSASSCGMLIRNLYKMIGVQEPSYARDYVFGEVIAKEMAFAKSVQALFKPGDTVPATEKQESSTLPRVGDAIYITNRNKDAFSQHFFVITGRGVDVVRRKGADGKERELPTVTLFVAQGGQAATAEFPDDGTCMGINEGVCHIAVDTNDPKKWKVGERFVEWWIDLTFLASGCDDDPFIKPVRKARY